MNIFTEVKSRVSAAEVAKTYGLKINRNMMACCPFHDDKHPSMKIDQTYYCFGCGEKGDAINYVAKTFGLSQIEAAKKIIQDFHLPIEFEKREKRKHLNQSRRGKTWKIIRWKKSKKDFISGVQTNVILF